MELGQFLDVVFVDDLICVDLNEDAHSNFFYAKLIFFNYEIQKKLKLLFE